MTSSALTDLDKLVAAAHGIGARPFKGATGDWSTAVEVALVDTILSIGAQVQGEFGAGVLPRLRAFKAFRGQANMMRVVATLGPFGLADFISEDHRIDQLLAAAGKLLDAGVNGAADLDPGSREQRDAVLATAGVPDLAWEYLLIATGFETPSLQQRKERWLDDFVAPIIDDVADRRRRDALLDEATAQLDAEHQRKSYGVMPAFTLPQLHQAIFRSEYARATAQTADGRTP